MLCGKLFMAGALALVIPVAMAQSEQQWVETPASSLPSVSEIYQAPLTAPLQEVVTIRAWAAHLRQQPPAIIETRSWPVLKVGDVAPEVGSLRTALQSRGFVVQMPAIGVDGTGNVINGVQGEAWLPSADVFDEALLAMVVAAQKAYGLSEDGVAGPLLYGKLSVDPQAQAAALEEWATSLDIQAMQARAAGHRKLIVVNIPAFTLKAFDLTTGATVVESRVIVGMPSRRTPRFTTNVVNLKYNPDWSPTSSMRARGKRYVAAGPNNPLGRIRFSTDNNMAIYLHHTNEERLFEKSSRALSSGCVRVESWDLLAAFVADKPVDAIMGSLVGGRTTYEKVETVPVWMAYSLVDVIQGQPSVVSDVYQQGPQAIGYGLKQ